MTDDEFSIFAKRLFIAFPDVWEWLSQFEWHKQTQAVWRDTLRPYRLDECLSVIESWITRKRPMFKAYERAQLAILIAACVQFDRDRARRDERSENLSREAIMRRRLRYQPIESPGIRRAFAEGRELMAARERGEISEEEFQKRKQELIDAVK